MDKLEKSKLQPVPAPWPQPVEGPHHCHSTGSVLVCVLVCMSVASALVVATTKTALQAQRQLRHQRQLRQTELLAEAGIERAVRRLSGDSSYRGETWELTTDVLPGYGAGQTRIVVAAVPEQSPLSYRIEVVARLGADSADGIQRSQKIVIATGPSGTQPP
jgi:hypothetical protein